MGRWFDFALKFVFIFLGVYLYAEASFPRREGDRARFLTPLLPGSGPKCLIFYYHMFGAEMGSLRVALVEEAREKAVWTREGNGGDLWRSARVDFRAESCQFRVTIFFFCPINGWFSPRPKPLDLFGRSCSKEEEERVRPATWP